jgi:uncharacterized membrane protein YdbT with pleckstrin-like domain
MNETRDSFRPSTMGWLRGTAAGLGTVLLAIAGPALMIGLAGEWGAWPLALTGLAALIVLWKWIQNKAALYEITPERLVVKRGIIFKSIDEIELYRIKDVRMDFSLLNQWAGIGNICLASSDETTRVGDLVMRHIEKARERREELRRLVDAARQRRGVREIDMVHEDVGSFGH